MRILMMTNTYAPVIGGIEESVRSFSQELRRQGHKVVIVAPEFEGMKHEKDVIRIPAIKNVIRPGFSLTLPIPIFLNRFVNKFQPDIIHSHQFFLVGDMALRLSRFFHVPLVYTHHILLEKYVNFLPIHNPKISRFVLKLATGYANLVDSVIAPSAAVYHLLKRSGVTKPMDIISTGVDIKRFAKGDGPAFRKKWNIPPDVFVAGCVCRLTPEKNLGFLAKAASVFLMKNKNSHCVVVGEGSYAARMKKLLKGSKIADRVHFTGVLQGQKLINAYHAMNIFMFSSHSETQGLVLLEAMACGTPVVVIDAPAYKDLVEDYKNGRIVLHEDEEAFSDAITWFAVLDSRSFQQIRRRAQATACRFSKERCTRRLLEIYQCLIVPHAAVKEGCHLWSSLKDCLRVEKDLLHNAIEATEAAFIGKTGSRKSYV